MDAKITDSKKTSNGKNCEAKKRERHKSLPATLTTVAFLCASMDDNIFDS